MQRGVVFPQTEIGNDPHVIKDYAQAVEGLGYDYLLVYDHVLGAHPDREPRLTGPYTHEHPFHEPMVLFGFLAAVTRRLQLTTGVIILPQRQTALVAKQAASAGISESLRGFRSPVGPKTSGANVWRHGRPSAPLTLLSIQCGPVLLRRKLTSMRSVPSVRLYESPD